MKNLLTVILMSVIFYSCDSIKGSGNIVTEKRNVGHFEGIRTPGSIDVEIRTGDEQAVEVEADDNVQEYVVVEVSGGSLNVHYKPNMAFMNTHTKVFVTTPSLEKLTASGSGDIISRETIKADDIIEINVSGSGSINAMVDAPTIKAKTSGSGNITLQGRTKNFECSASGSGDIKCKSLLSEYTDVKTTGSGSAHVYASVKLKVVSTGSGDIYYSGNPPSPELRKSGSGELRAE